MGDAFGSRWDTEGGTASFTSSWALEKEEPKEEVTISSIQPIGERYLHACSDFCLYSKNKMSCSLDWVQLCPHLVPPLSSVWSRRVEGLDVFGGGGLSGRLRTERFQMLTLVEVDSQNAL